MVAPTTPFPRLASEFRNPRYWEYKPILALRHDLIVYEAASLKHPLPCSFLNEAGRPLTHPGQRVRLNRPVRKTECNLNSRRGPRKLRRLKAGTNLTRGPSLTGC
jgi:hypothetical protein